VNVQPLDVRTAALKQECLNQFQNCGYTALTFTIWLRFLRWIKLFSLFAPVVLGALATWNIVGDSMPAAAAVCAFLAVLIPPTFQAAKIDPSIKRYTTIPSDRRVLVAQAIRRIRGRVQLSPFKARKSKVAWINAAAFVLSACAQAVASWLL
jgi:hypothetical protein